MKFFLAATAICYSLAVGASASEQASEAKPAMADSIWTGRLSHQTLHRDGSTVEHKSFPILVVSCAGRVQIWEVLEAGGLTGLGKGYSIASTADTHLLFFLDKSPDPVGWAEVHAFLFTQITQDTAVLNWSRTVNNRTRPADHHLRYYYDSGAADLTRVSESCDPKLIPNEPGGAS